MVGMELLWRFYGKINLEIVWGFHGQNMVDQITRQSPYQFYHKISIESITPHTVSVHAVYIISTYYGYKIFSKLNKKFDQSKESSSIFFFL